MKSRVRSNARKLLALALVTAVLAGAAPAAAAVLKEAGSTATTSKFSSVLGSEPKSVVKLGSVVVSLADEPAVQKSTAAPVAAALTSASIKADAVVPKAVPSVTAAAATAEKPKAPAATSTALKRTTPTATASELAQAQSILSSLIAKYPILSGTTVSIGTTPGGYQAVAYYQSGRILISETHTASLTTILNHEIWHIIDWRDNGVIDWGESIPPSNASSYAN
jgi:hypothetical protein